MLPIDPENRGRGRPPEQNRSIINGILWRLRCGAPCRDAPPTYGSWNTSTAASDAGAKPSFPVGQTVA
ncbi:transposase [Sphingomonas psychrotolerans]|uniref:transposase n=1 Tax=Sphingomonas psychrotolerans TaxID=1327635 RepID=UPI00389A2692